MELTKFKQSELSEVRKELIKMQGGLCPLCKRSLLGVRAVNIVIDHDHKTGVVRAAMHRSCNGVEGKILRVLSRWGSLKSLPAIIKYFDNLVAFWKLHKTPQTKWIYYGHKTVTEKRLLTNKRRRLAAQRLREKRSRR